MFFALWKALLASGFLLATNFEVAEPFKSIVQQVSPSWKYVGCYSSSAGLNNKTSYTFQSYGWCLDRCVKTNVTIFALTRGSECLCGNVLPPSSAKVAESKCNQPCWGFPSEICGGNEFFSVYTTGLKSEFPTPPQSPTTSNVSKPQSTASAQSDSESKTPAEKTPSSSKTGAIVGGAVGGVCGAAVIVGCVIIIWRHKKRKDTGKYDADTSGNDANAIPSSELRSNDGYIMQRRRSNGSIEDYREFPSRNLHVTNPDEAPA